MELNGISEFRKELEIINSFQTKMISILSCDESQVSQMKQVYELLNFFEEITISQNFSLYEAFLRILVHLSIYFNFPETKVEVIYLKRQEIFSLILKELIFKHSLKTSFHQFSLFVIFKSNKHFLLFLFEEGIFDISFMLKKISFFRDKNLFLFFIPEIQIMNPKFYENLKKQFKLTEEDIKNEYLKIYGEKEEEEKRNYTEIRRKIHSQEELAKIIQSDVVNDFISFISKNSNFDLNSRIRPSFLENNPDINNDNEGISVLEYSMAFGSINVFRYLWIKKVKYSKNSLKYCLIGNHYEILHLLEEDEKEESQIEFDDNNYRKSIEYYHPEIIEYFSNFNYINHSNKINDSTLFSFINIFSQTYNVEILNYFFLQNEISQFSPITESQYFSTSNHFNSTFDINTILFDVINFQQSPFYFVYNFLLKQTNIDINFHDSILILVNS
ncbi:hypothetical protein TRFO_42094 [Tritrichomonas foetus]|uniref:DUF3447 domain-containing protein n=1 Tax=Tritrichomonas foetus TaxID=1144522 RepID=A0A1J4L2E0_9EUKA|nr:hypothetical protein TRFO_42094 [Tritrichomonas foetus]|eukprot:OHT16061.1 hypothetical protein TRFO_42094 [Tritrichomonas foetus]